MRHRNIIRLFEVLETEEDILIVMEYASGGDMLQFMKKRRSVPEPEAKKIFRQIVNSVGHCHCRSVLHRDVKLDNLLIDSAGQIKLCDFGISRIITDPRATMHEQCGTPAYIAPEIMADKGYSGFKSDIWSMGILLFALVCGCLPFRANSIEDLKALIIEAKVKFPEQVAIEGGDRVDLVISPEYKDLVMKTLETCPEKRITIPEILCHPWMTGAQPTTKPPASKRDSTLVGNINLVVPEILFL